MIPRLFRCIYRGMLKDKCRLKLDSGKRKCLMLAYGTKLPIKNLLTGPIYQKYGIFK